LSEVRALDVLARLTADLIERSRGEEALRRGEERFSRVMNNMAEGLYTTDEKGLVTFVNPAAEKILGWTSAELLRTPRRLTTPLVRRDGELAPASWDEAFDVVADAIVRTQAAYGRDAVAVFGGGGLTNEKAYQLGKFARVALRTSQIDYNGRWCMSSAAAAGIRCVNLAGWSDPDRVRKLYELNEKTIQDVPHTLTIVREAFEDFAKRLEAPDRPHGRYWIALAGDRPVAMSFLKFPPVRGTVWTGYTCTEAEFRGRGIARAIKLQSLAQAVELGIPLVCTDNDSENAPMLHINEKLGYVRRPGFVEHHKRVRNSINA
jgi:RimJ/RimL family protein N-acetyltransferase